jgi:hypothetical protein
MKSTGMIVFCLFILLVGCHKDSDRNPPPLGFPFDKIAVQTERFDEDIYHEIIDVILGREDFSEGNLDKLFRHFLRQYSVHNHLIVRVYINPENYRESLKVPKEEQYGNDIGINSFCDAIFYKLKGREWYMYNLDLEHRLIYNFNTKNGEKVRIVTIKGDF